MKIRLVLALVMSILVLSACSYTFPSEIKSSQLDKTYEMVKMEVVDPVAPQQNLYFVRALFVFVDENDATQSVQGVKIKWSYLGGDYVTTLPLNKVRWEVDSSIDVPTFKVDWDQYYMSRSAFVSPDYSDDFQDEGNFNPNDILEKQKYYSQVVMKLNQADYDLVMSYIFK